MHVWSILNKPFIHIISFTSHNNLWIRHHYYAHFTGKETEVHSVVTCLTDILLKTIGVSINWQWIYPQGTFDKPIPKKKKCKMVVWGGLTNSWEKRRSKRQRRKGNIYPSECRVPKKSKESPFFVIKLRSPALQADSLPTELWGKLQMEAHA